MASIWYVVSSARVSVSSAPWGTVTYNPQGWKAPCYLITDDHYEDYDTFMRSVDWDHYSSGQDLRYLDRDHFFYQFHGSNFCSKPQEAVIGGPGDPTAPYLKYTYFTGAGGDADGPNLLFKYDTDPYELDNVSDVGGYSDEITYLNGKRFECH